MQLPKTLSGLATFLMTSGMAASIAVAQEPVPVSIAVYPPNAQINTTRDRQSIVVQATYADGITRDVTKQATFAFGNPAFVKFENHTMYPVADGKTELKVDFGGKSVVVPVEVAQATADRPISFKLDVMPVFMKAGCNTGSCHGAARQRRIPSVAVRLRPGW